jgi:YbbR domain-containing protein
LVVSTAADVRAFHIMPATVSVTVSGPSAVMAVLQPSQVRAVVDLTGIEAAKELVRSVDVSLPPGIGVRLVDVTPRAVTVVVPPPADKS